jgi:hypothetical protein
MVGFPELGTSSTQGLYLYTTAQHIKTRTDINTLSGFRTHNPNIQVSKLHLRPRGQCDWQ